jgi:hypothetical protein
MACMTTFGPTDRHATARGPASRDRQDAAFYLQAAGQSHDASERATLRRRAAELVLPFDRVPMPKRENRPIR